MGLALKVDDYPVRSSDMSCKALDRKHLWVQRAQALAGRSRGCGGSAGPQRQGGAAAARASPPR